MSRSTERVGCELEELSEPAGVLVEHALPGPAESHDKHERLERALAPGHGAKRWQVVEHHREHGVRFGGVGPERGIDLPSLAGRSRQVVN